MQTLIFDQAEAALRTHEGIEKSFGGASPEWKQAATDALTHCAYTQHQFTADSFWAELEVICRFRNIDCASVNKSASGGVFTRAKRAGLILKTNRTRPSQRPVAHQKELPVWESEVYGQRIAA